MPSDQDFNIEDIISRFSNGKKIRSSMQEHVRYKEALNYLQKKCRTKLKA